MKKLTLFISAFTLAILCGASYGVNSPSTQDVTVRVNNETLIAEQNNSITVLRGIPFATPPIGDLRWQAPQLHVPREGIQNAKTFAAGCMQGPQMVAWYQDIAETFGKPRDTITSPTFNENCLYLNVWAPTEAIKNNQKLPVMVWIHGGSNKGGWSYEPNYFGHQLAQQGVIVVSIAYRVGVFGFFSHPQITAEQQQGTNFGLLDQIMALQWVQNNIRSLGGNPNNVTVFGESAGAADIGFLIAADKAKGLFKRAIHQSAGFEILRELTTSDHEQLGLSLAKQLNVSEDKKTLSHLRELPAQAILAASTEVHQGHYFSPAANEFLLKSTLLSAYQNGRINPVDLMIGSNAAENYMYNPSNTTQQHIATEINQHPEAIRAPLNQAISNEDDLKFALDRLISAHQMLCPSRFIAKQVNTQSDKVWNYFFTQVREGKGGEQLKAYHGAEIPYAFDTHDDWMPTNSSDQQLTQIMMHYWLNFAKTGNPNDEQLPQWPAYKTQQAIELGKQVHAIEFPDQALCELFINTL